MAPNLTGGRIRSEALDRFLGQHDSHESLEITRDDKIENLEMLDDEVRDQQPSDAGESTQQNDVPEITGINDSVNNGKIGQGSDVNDEVTEVVEDSAFEMIGDGDNDGVSVQFGTAKSLKRQTVTVIPENARDSETLLRAFLLGKSFSTSVEPANLPALTGELANKELKQNARIADIDPEEALIRHDTSIGRGLQVQQGELLEKALKETVSITKEEEEWAVVEKQMAEDLSFAKSVEKVLQSSDANDNNENLPVLGNLRNSDHLVLSETQRLPHFFYPTSSGSPPVVPQSAVRETTYRPILSKRTTVNADKNPLVHQDQGRFFEQSGPSVPVQSRFSIEISTPTSYFNNESDSPLRISDSQPPSTSRRRPSVLPSPPQSPSQSSTTIPIEESKIQSTSSERRENSNKSTPQATTDRSSHHHSTQSEANASRKSHPPTTTKKSNTHSLDSIYQTTTPTHTGILQIPGHAPEAPADLNLVHHDLSLPFLRGQGARVLNSEPAMTAEGATAVILSCVCLVFIALIGLAFFIKNQRKKRVFAKLAANMENQRDTHFTTDDGLTTYKLQPAPLAILKSTPVMSKMQQPPYTATSTFGTPYPTPNQTHVMTSKPSFSVTNNYPQMSTSLTSKPPRQSSICSDDSTSENAILAAKIREKSKMAASCSNDQSKMAPNASNCSLPSYDEVQSVKKEVCITSSCGSSNSSTGGASINRRGKLWFALSYDAVEEALLLHVQQARYSQARSAGRVWVEACVLTNRNDVHTVARTDVTTATQSPVFNSRIAFQVAIAHLDQLLLRMTLYLSTGGSEDTALGSVIVPLHSTDLSEKTTLIRDLN